MVIEKVLVVDDEPLMLRFIAEVLQRKKIEVVALEDPVKALELLKTTSFDCIITDIKMPNLSGLELLKAAKEMHPQVIVILITAHATLENAVEALRLGAFNYLIKPFSPDTLDTLIDKASEQMALLHENQFLKQEIAIQSSHKKNQNIAESGIMKQILADVAKIARSSASVFISG